MPTRTKASSKFLTLSALLLTGALWSAPAEASPITHDVRATYDDSVSAMVEVNLLIRSGLGDFAEYSELGVYLDARRVDALTLLAEAEACGVECRDDIPTIHAALVNFGSSLVELQDHALQAYGWYIQCCCKEATSTLGTSCQQVNSHYTICGGVCWICKEGWSNQDGTIGRADGETQECPK